MSDFYDESGFAAPQLDHPMNHDRIMSQSGYDGELAYVLKWISDRPLVLPIAVIAIGTTTFALW